MGSPSRRRARRPFFFMGDNQTPPNLADTYAGRGDDITGRAHARKLRKTWTDPPPNTPCFAFLRAPLLLLLHPARCGSSQLCTQLPQRVTVISCSHPDLTFCWLALFVHACTHILCERLASRWVCQTSSRRNLPPVASQSLPSARCSTPRSRTTTGSCPAGSRARK